MIQTKVLLGKRNEPYTGCVVEISRDTHIYVGMYVYCMPKYVGGITWPNHAHGQNQFWKVKTDLWHPYYSILLYARAALAWTKKQQELSLRNETLKSNRASETEEQRKERLRIRREKDRARRRTKKLQEEKQDWRRW